MQQFMNDEPKKVKKGDFQVNTPNIYETTDYRQFKTVKGNREVNSKHVAGLMSSIAKNNLLHKNPIIVNQKMEVIDGQHRLQAARGLKVPVYFVVFDPAGLSEIQQLNTYVKPWTTADYLQSYVANGSQKYVEFERFLKEYGIQIQTGFLLILNDNNSKIYRTFKDGGFTFTEEQMEAARLKMDIIWDIQKYFKEQRPRSVYFFRAFNYVWDKGLANQLKDKIATSEAPLTQLWTMRDYMRSFEDILNWKTKGEPVRLF